MRQINRQYLACLKAPPTNPEHIMAKARTTTKKVPKETLEAKAAKKASSPGQDPNEYTGKTIGRTKRAEKRR
jgi:hypothetical protein